MGLATNGTNGNGKLNGLNSADLSARLKADKERAERARTEKARAEATLENIESQRAQLIEEIRAQGVEPENLDSEIERLEAEIAAGLAEVERLLPAENGGR